MRLFVAINFSEETKARLCDIQRILRSSVKSGRFTDPANLHLTLAFLGECSQEEVKKVKEALSSLSFSSFDLVLDRLGCFRRNSGDLWWAGVKLTQMLQDLQADVAKCLSTSGFILETRDYKPHVTIAREVSGKYYFRDPVRINETVCAFDLMKSERITLTVFKRLGER